MNSMNTRTVGDLTKAYTGQTLPPCAAGMLFDVEFSVDPALTGSKRFATGTFEFGKMAAAVVAGQVVYRTTDYETWTPTSAAAGDYQQKGVVTAPGAVGDYVAVQRTGPNFAPISTSAAVAANVRVFKDATATVATAATDADRLKSIGTTLAAAVANVLAKGTVNLGSQF